MIIEKEAEDYIGKLAIDNTGIVAFYCGIGYFDRIAKKYYLGQIKDLEQFYCYYDIKSMKLFGSRIEPKYFINK